MVKGRQNCRAALLVMALEEQLVTSINKFLGQYKWLSDSYVIEFFTEAHWSKLPQTWREALSAAELKEVAHLLLRDQWRHSSTSCRLSRVYPLSLLAFASTAQALSLPRAQLPPETAPEKPPAINQIPSEQLSNQDKLKREGLTGRRCDFGEAESSSAELKRRTGGASQIAGLEHSFRRHVKPKKQHEILLLGEAVSRLSKETSCRNIMDIGSGQGHLARYLAYHSGLQVTAVEALGCHLTMAAKFDREVETDLHRKLCSRGGEAEGYNSGSVKHVAALIHPEVSVGGLLRQLGLSSSNQDPACCDCPVEPAGQSVMTHTLPPSLPSTIQSDHRPHLAVQDPLERKKRCLVGHSATAVSPKANRFILVGLHTCGDLAPTMVRVFSESQAVVGLVSVGCCYMKLTCNNKTHPETSSSFVTHEHTHKGASSGCLGYPMSQFVKTLPDHTLSYEAREVACHSIESYLERIQDGRENVRVHCHRAAVETVLRKMPGEDQQEGLEAAIPRVSCLYRHWPVLPSSSSSSSSPFLSYAKALLQSVNLPTDIEAARLEGLVAQWSRVAVFFTLRLVLAPCVESVLLLDRALFLREQGCGKVSLMALFDPKLSPRNLVLIAKQ